MPSCPRQRARSSGAAADQTPESNARRAAAIALPPTVAALSLPHHYLLLAILMTALALFRLRENIQRLSRGEEPKFQKKAEIKGPPEIKE